METMLDPSRTAGLSVVNRWTDGQYCWPKVYSALFSCLSPITIGINGRVKSAERGKVFTCIVGVWYSQSAREPWHDARNGVRKGRLGSQGGERLLFPSG